MKGGTGRIRRLSLAILPIGLGIFTLFSTGFIFSFSETVVFVFVFLLVVVTLDWVLSGRPKPKIRTTIRATVGMLCFLVGAYFFFTLFASLLLTLEAAKPYLVAYLPSELPESSIPLRQYIKVSFRNELMVYSFSGTIWLVVVVISETVIGVYMFAAYAILRNLRGGQKDGKLTVAASLIVLTLVIGGMYLGYYNYLRTYLPFEPFHPFPQLEITDVKAYPTSRMILCKIHNSGNVDETLIEVRVNGSIVDVVDPLPMSIRYVDYQVYAFQYDGPWEGLIQITFYLGNRWRWEKTVDYTVISTAENNYLKDRASAIMFAAQSKTSRVVGPQSPDAKKLLSIAGSKLAEAQNAYNRGDYEGADQLAASALTLADEAIAAEESYQALEAKMLAAVAIALPVMISLPVIGLLLLRRSRSPQQRHSLPAPEEAPPRMCEQAKTYGKPQLTAL